MKIRSTFKKTIKSSRRHHVSCPVQMNKLLSPEHQEALRRAAPRFFYSPLVHQTPFSERGFEIGDGWFEIVHHAALDIEVALGDREVYCIQIKEKFGELCIYPSAYHDDIQEIIQRATTTSRFTCEICGAPGKRTTIGHVLMKTICDDHSR